MRRLLLTLLTLAAVLLPAAATMAGAARDARGGAVLTLRQTRYGRILVDGRGFALYLFTRDRGPRSACAGACAAAWPPFFTRGRPHVRGLDGRKLGTTRRRGGLQVTYAGHPLYYYVGDTAPGVVTCQGVVQFGGTWLVVGPRGNAIR